MLISYIFVGLLAVNHTQYTFSVVSLHTELITIVCVYTLFFLLFRVNKVIWRYASGRDYMFIFFVACLSGLFIFVCYYIIAKLWFPLHSYVLSTLTSATIIIITRYLYREFMIYRKKYNAQIGNKAEGKRLLIVGAGMAGSHVLNEIYQSDSTNLIPSALVDDDIQKLGRTVGNIKVAGTVADIAKICRDMHIDVIYIAIPSATNEIRSYILNECVKTGCVVKILPHIAEIDLSNQILSNIRDITPEELLGREPVNVANDEILDFVKNKTVLITGGGGSIGSELCRQVMSHQPKCLIIIDIYENNAYAIEQELIGKYGAGCKFKVYIASVREYNKILKICQKEKPDIILHAAAHKHVPLMETSPDEAVKNNIFGTFNTATAAMVSGAERFILISSDKAVNPTNIMGATKRVCEMIIQYMNTISKKTSFAAVRFGNVLGSNGSVIPLFMEQIRNRSNITVTHPEIIRYFMTIPEASQLVLTAGAMAKGGEIFVLDMGQPVRIDDLAKKMVSLSGLTLGVDINIVYTGLRPGEKLYEELLMSEEGIRKTSNDKIFIGNLINIDYDKLLQQLNEIEKLVSNPETTSEEIEKSLMRIVPTFVRYNSDDIIDIDKIIYSRKIDVPVLSAK